eukprot:m.6590 g.6590  ORF g.6590 m.6590 type:complete len:917 (+) comp3556_c0_seq1:120-2870(+)
MSSPQLPRLRNMTLDPSKDSSKSVDSVLKRMQRLQGAAPAPASNNIRRRGAVPQRFVSNADSDNTNNPAPKTEASKISQEDIINDKHAIQEQLTAASEAAVADAETERRLLLLSVKRLQRALTALGPEVSRTVKERTKTTAAVRRRLCQEIDLLKQQADDAARRVESGYALFKKHAVTTTAAGLSDIEIASQDPVSRAAAALKSLVKQGWFSLFLDIKDPATSLVERGEKAKAEIAKAEIRRRQLQDAPTKGLHEIAQLVHTMEQNFSEFRKVHHEAASIVTPRLTDTVFATNTFMRNKHHKEQQQAQELNRKFAKMVNCSAASQGRIVKVGDRCQVVDDGPHGTDMLVDARVTALHDNPSYNQSNRGNDDERFLYDVEIFIRSTDYAVPKLDIHNTMQYVLHYKLLHRQELYMKHDALSQPLPEAAKMAHPELVISNDVSSALYVRILYSAAEAAQKSLHVLADSLAKAGNGTTHEVPLKSVKRTLVKAATKYGGRIDRVLDICRETVVMDNFGDIIKAMRVLEDWLSKGKLRIVRAKNRLMTAYDASVASGYRDMLFNLMFPTEHEGTVQWEHITELQITLRGLYDIKTSGGHAIYRIGRFFSFFEKHTAIWYGQLTEETLEDLAQGMYAEVESSGTTLTPDLLELLFNKMASKGSRAVLLNISGCSGSDGQLLSKHITQRGLYPLHTFTSNGIGWVGEIPRNLFGDRTCATLGHLELANNKLTGKIPGALLARCTHLKSLSLYDNEFEGVFPVELCSLPQLKVLSLGKNRLNGPLPPELYTMPRLTRLSLQLNKFNGPIPEDIGNLKQLAYVNFNRNFFTGPIPASFATLPLETLNLENNNMDVTTVPQGLYDRKKNNGLVLKVSKQNRFYKKEQNDDSSSENYAKGRGGGHDKRRGNGRGRDNSHRGRGRGR